MMRIKNLSLAVGIVLLFLLFGIFNLQIICCRRLKDMSKKNCVRIISQEGARGKIFDSGGNMIAGSYLAYDLAIMPQDKKQTERALSAVSDITGIGLVGLRAVFKRNYTASFMPVTVVKNIDFKKALIFGEMKAEYNNIIIQPRPVRYYPFGKSGAHIIGYLGEIDRWRLSKLGDYGYNIKDIVGFGGIEEKYDYYLRPDDGALSIEVNHRGRFARLLGFKPPGDGKDIRLTLDIRMQRIAEEALSGVKGSVIIMDPYTGEVMAMASFPDFSPSDFSGSFGFSAPALAESALLNRAISGVYPPASVFKLVPAAAGLETGKINLTASYFCAGSIRIGNREYGCWSEHKEENLKNAIAHSCDIYFYRTGIALGPQAIYDYALKFGFSKPTSVDLPYEASGFVPNPLWKRTQRMQNWFDGDTANFVIGQGDLLVTPIQIARFMAAFANKGMLVRPYLVKAIDNKDMSAAQRKYTVVPIKRNILDCLRNDLRAVVALPDGTADMLSDLPVTVAGKTGTAQVGNNSTHGWFAGFFPFDKPKFVICVFIENRGSGQSAAGLTKTIIERMIGEKLIR